MTRLFGQASGRQGQRSYTRLRLGIPAVLVLPHGRITCTLDDLSVSGARIRADQPVRAGLSAELRFERYALFCTVAWARGIQAGLTFADYLSGDDMKRMLWIVENRDIWEQRRFTLTSRN